MDEGAEGLLQTPSGEGYALHGIIDEMVGDVVKDTVRGVDGLAVDIEEIAVVVTDIGLLELVPDEFHDSRFPRTGLADHEYVRRFVLFQGGAQDIHDILDLRVTVDELGGDVGILENTAVIDDIVLFFQVIIEYRYIRQTTFSPILVNLLFD